MASNEFACHLSQKMFPIPITLNIFSEIGASITVTYKSSVYGLNCVCGLIVSTGMLFNHLSDMVSDSYIYLQFSLTACDIFFSSLKPIFSFLHFIRVYCKQFLFI
jgi:hypothetical protein